MLLIGIDCATKDDKVGLACAEYVAREARLVRAEVGSGQGSVATKIVGWLTDVRVPALLALDAPLGWPVALSQSLLSHQAGQLIATTPSEMFRRETDRFIKKELAKTSLDVGADRIARTAHAALRLLGEVRERLGIGIPLAWSPAFAGVAAIEVYPAATLTAHGFPSVGYKERDQIDIRRRILASIRPIIDHTNCVSALEKNPDALDAAVCVLAAKDFIDGTALPPENFDLAKKEGWIWAPPHRV